MRISDWSSDVCSSDLAIVVTGLRGLSSKTAVESPAPIDIVPADRLTGTGRQEIGEALARTLPSINFGRTGAGVASIVRPIFNRSLPPAYTLILVDGKRRHNRDRKSVV